MIATRTAVSSKARAFGVVTALAVWCAGAMAGAAPPPLPSPSAKLPPPPVQPELGPLEDDGTDPRAIAPTRAPPPSDEEKHALRLYKFSDHYGRAKVAADRERWDEATREYTTALDLLPGDPNALLGRAYAYKGRVGEGQCSRRAIADLLDLARHDPRGMWLTQRSLAIDWMGECGSRYHRRRVALAQELAEEVPGSPGRPDEIRVTLAELLRASGMAEETTPLEQGQLEQAALDQLARYREELQTRGLQPSSRGLQLAAQIHLERDELKQAAEWFGELLRLHPDDARARDASRMLEELRIEIDLRQLDETQGFRPTEDAQAAYNRGVQALGAGNLDVAYRELSWAIGDSPWFPRAHYARGVALARMEKIPQAVDDLSRAIRMDRSDYRAHMTLGLIYKKKFAGAEDEEAIKHLSAAVRLRPDLHRMHLLLGELYARTDRQRAREHYQRFIQLAPLGDPEARTARKALEELEREIRRDEPTPIPSPAAESLRFLDPALQSMINEAYLRGTEHQDWEVAEKILLAAKDQFPEEPVVLNELARVVYYQDRLGDARRFWEQSLEMREQQVEVHERLGVLLRDDRPEAAVPHLRRAAELGSATARFLLAESLWSGAKPLDASKHLNLYLAAASELDLHWERAQALRREIDARFFQFYLAAAVLLGIAIVLPALRLWRHYRGSSLRQLLERAPKSFPEVARILSLIRHEILKHNTAFLADVGRALELDAPDAEQRAAVLGQRLFGIDGRDDPGGIHGRFLGYVDDLEKVARSHRVTLNLYRKDPIFRPMISAFDQLAHWGPRMRRADTLRPSQKLELSRCLERCSGVLGRQAFERLSDLIRELCVTNVDVDLVTRVFENVRGEKQFSGSPIAPVEVRGMPAPVRIFRTDLEDILANVFRNSLRSSVSYAPPPARLAVEFATEIDEITGLGSIAVRIKDRSPEQLSTEMLRGRYVERGMGITVDLLSRYDGSIAVEAEPGWSKAVVLRFFILEDDANTLTHAEAAQ